MDEKTSYAFERLHNKIVEGAVFYIKQYPEKKEEILIEARNDFENFFWIWYQTYRNEITYSKAKLMLEEFLEYLFTEIERNLKLNV